METTSGLANDKHLSAVKSWVRRGRTVTALLEVKLNAGDSIQLQMINQLSTDPAGSEFLIQGIQAYRERNPLWEVVGSLEDSGRTELPN